MKIFNSKRNKLILMFVVAIIIFIIFLLFSNKDSSINEEKGGTRNQSELTETKDLDIATPQNPLISPSGKYQLEILEGFNGIVQFYRFNITKFEGKGVEPAVVFSSKDTFRKRDRVIFIWDKEDRVWVYSGDVGTAYWTKVNDENWTKSTGNLDNAPEKLKQLITDH